MSNGPYRTPARGPSVDDVRMRECRHLNYREATSMDGPERLDFFPLVCLDCGRRLVE